MPPDFLVPEWPAPAWIRACVSTRTGGVSTAEFASLNPAFHVGDDAEAVRRNRVIIAEAIGGDVQIQWLSQVHGTQVIEASSPGSAPEADGCFTRSTGLACAVMTADCLPVLLCDRLGTEVAAVHCGWRGLAAGIVQVAVERFQCPATDLLAWLGPAIGPAAFEVGDDVREAFALRAKDAGWALGWDEAFRPSKATPGRYMADLYALTRWELASQGVVSVHGGGLCTFTGVERFFSYRRDGACGRMASLIWIQPH